MDKKLSIIGVLGASAVLIGAFGAHGLKKIVSDAAILHAYETGVHYHFYHVLALCFVYFLIKSNISKSLRYAWYFFIVGIILFSGSLYGIALASAFQFSKSILGPITPIGGVFFVLGWCMVVRHAMRKNG